MYTIKESESLTAWRVALSRHVPGPLANWSVLSQPTEHVEHDHQKDSSWSTHAHLQKPRHSCCLANFHISLAFSYFFNRNNSVHLVGISSTSREHTLCCQSASAHFQHSRILYFLEIKNEYKYQNTSHISCTSPSFRPGQDFASMLQNCPLVSQMFTHPPQYLAGSLQ